MTWIVLYQFARSKLGLVIIGVVVMVIAGTVLIRRHNARIIADHDAAGIEDVRNRANEAIRNRDAVPADPGRLRESGDPNCRDCR